jgi:hypothetical protein
MAPSAIFLSIEGRVFAFMLWLYSEYHVFKFRDLGLNSGCGGERDNMHVGGKKVFLSMLLTAVDSDWTWDCTNKLNVARKPVYSAQWKYGLLLLMQ